MKIDEPYNFLLMGRIDLWNNYRKKFPKFNPDFKGEDLSNIDFVPNVVANLSYADFRGAKLPNTDYLSYQGQTVNVEGAIIDSDALMTTDFDLLSEGVEIIYKTEENNGKHPSTVDVFISYAWANEKVIIAIDYWLRSKGIKTRLDKRDFFAGSRIRDEITRIMSDCQVILIFHSQQSKDKPWIQFERELAADLEMSAKVEQKQPPRIIYIIIDDTELPTLSEKQRIAIMAKGKRFELVCEEIYHAILQIPKQTEEVDLSKWSDYIF